jgi:chromosome segregation ATPase
MSATRLTLKAVLVIILFGGFPAIARAQLQKAQERGWSGLKDAYSVVASMKDNKSNRTPSNFETVLGKTLTATADMKPYVEKMGEKVADEDRSYATGLRDNVLNALNSVAEARDKLKSAYDAAKDTPGKMEEMTDDIDRLKYAMERYDEVCKNVYQAYKGRWEEIYNKTNQLNKDGGEARDKLKGLLAKLSALEKEELALEAEKEKLNESQKKLTEALQKINDTIKAMEEKWTRETVDGKAEDAKRTSDEMARLGPVRGELMDRRLDNVAHASQILDAQKKRIEEEKKVQKEIETAALNPTVQLVAPERFVRWDTEFPAKSYSYQSLK